MTTTALDRNEISAYKSQKIKQELHDRRFLEEILKKPAKYRTTADKASLKEILLSFPCF